MWLTVWITDLVSWLCTPSIRPWVGAFAAIVAALTVDTKSWLKSPVNGVGRAIRVALLWLVVTWIIGRAGHFGYSGGLDEAGEGQSQGTGKASVAADGGNQVTVAPGAMPSGSPNNVVLIISFVPTIDNETVAQDYSCDLIRKGTGDGVKKIEIRAVSMHDFDKMLVQQLRGVKIPDDITAPVIKIKRTPYPGENVVRRVGEKVRAVLTTGNLEFD